MNDYHLWEAIGDIDEKLILEVNNVGVEKLRKQRRASVIKRAVSIGVAACLTISLVSIAVVAGIGNTNVPTLENGIPPQNVVALATPVIDAELNEGEVFYEGVKLNRGEPYSIEGYRVKLKETTKSVFDEKFDLSGIEIEDAEAYFTNSDEENDDLIGVAKIGSNNKSFKRVRLSKNSVDDEVYEGMEKTEINGISVAIGYDGRVNDLGEAAYYAMYQDGEVSYTIEGKEQTLTQFIDALSEILNSYEK